MKTKSITLAFTLLFCASGFTYAEEESKKNDDLNVEVLPDRTVKIVPVKTIIEKKLKNYVAKLVEDFNTANPSIYKSYYHFPHAKVFTTEIEWISDPNKPVVDFDKLRATGWVKSRTNEIEVMYATNDKGVVRLNFSRIDKDGNVIITTDAIYTLTKIKDKWGISVVFAAASNLPLN